MRRLICADLKQSLGAAQALMRSNAAKESVYLREAANADKLRAGRARNGADEKYCWKS